MNLYYTDDRPESGWRILKLDDGTWRAEQIAGPRALTANNVGGLVQQLAGDDDALRRRYTEDQIRQAATAAACNPDAISTQLRAMPA
jgi:hypothetical protein